LLPTAGGGKEQSPMLVESLENVSSAICRVRNAIKEGKTQEAIGSLETAKDELSMARALTTTGKNEAGKT